MPTRRTHGGLLQLRVGLNAGEVVVRAIGNDLHTDYSAVGQHTHLAARMEQLAAPGSILLAAATLRLVEGLVLLQQGMAVALGTGQELPRPLCLVLLAEAAGHGGQVVEGLRWLAETLTAIEESGRAELQAGAYRLQGKLLLRQVGPDAAQAETCFQQALSIARRRQATSLELRAAMSLSWVWQRQGKRDEARELLAPIVTATPARLHHTLAPGSQPSCQHGHVKRKRMQAS